MQDFEKLGSFYLGKVYDIEKRARTDALVLYDSKDLCTHAVCVGMTGSGKTGLCLTLLEEAAIDNIPSIIIDPKGDLSNLLLTFPDLKPEDFAPWVNADDAAKSGVTPAQLAEQQAARWSKGLAEWNQDGARVRKLRDSADFSIYTPGSTAGLPVSILKSLDAPDPAVREDTELFRACVSTTATSLLGLLGIDADPIRSREHILLSTLLARAWGAGHSLELGALIAQVQNPPVTKVGVMDLDSFYPAKDRFELAMALNNLLAAPGFSTWMEGEPLNIDALLHTKEGKPRVSIFSIAHLSDAERMFFVSLLLNQTLGWVRTQSGTTSLRAILYMDEIAGYFPPTANPPSKLPLLTLMKQARAFGMGIVLATQNPVDLDYKGLSNAGTWFIGRLQTERDKARVLDGLEGAAAAASAKFDRSSIETLLSQLGSRVFLMNNVHEDAPEIIETRWALSYLRGPLTRAQIKSLMDAKRTGAAPAAASAAASSWSSSSTAAPSPTTPSPRPGGAGVPPATTRPTPSPSPAFSASRPLLPPDVPQYFVPIRTTVAGAALAYSPRILACGRVYYSDPKSGVDTNVPASFLTPFGDGPLTLDWDHAQATELTDTDVEKDPEAAGTFESLPTDAGKLKSYEAWKKSFADTLYRTHKLELLRSTALEEVSRPNENERDFRLRLQQKAREIRDATSAKLRQKYAPRQAQLADRLRRAQQRVEEQAAQARSAKIQTAISFGSAILGAFLGRKAVSSANIGKASTAMRGVGRSMKESGDVGRAEESVEAVQQQIAELEAEVKSELDAAAAAADPLTETFEKISLRPKKTNITVRAVVLAWVPRWVDAAGRATDAWE